MPTKGPVLEITDGTYANTINLISPGKGYHLCDWKPSRPDLEYGVRKNWFTGQETPATVVLKPHVEAFTFTANRSTQDDLIELEAKFNRILVLAARFWSGDRNVKNPFYIRMKAKNESYERYAVVAQSKLHNSGNPFSSPFASRRPAEQDLQVALTHNGWRDFPPGQAEDITQDLNSEMTSIVHGDAKFGVPSRIPVTLGEVHMANYHSQANISHIFRGISTINYKDHQFSSATDTVAIFTVNDVYTYFGSEQDTQKKEHKTFGNVVFNLAPASPGRGPTTWEYSVGSGVWLPLPGVRGNTQLIPFSQTTMVTWDKSNSWERDVVNGVDAYWVRMSGASDDILQMGYSAYAASWPYIDIENNAPGDGGSVFDISVLTSIDPVTGGEFDPVLNRIIIGARELNDINRGFIPYISPGLSAFSGITWDGPLVEDFSSYSLQVVQESLVTHTGPSISSMRLNSVNINFFTAAAYSGTYRAFLRLAAGKDNIETGKAYFWLDVKDVGGSANRTTFSTRKVTDSLSFDYITVLDMGSITLGTNPVSGFGLTSGVLEQDIDIMWQVYDDISIGEWLTVYDIVLIPQDMWYADVSFSGGLLNGGDELVISSASTVDSFAAVVRDLTNHDVYQSPLVAPGSPVHFFTNEDVRLYFMMLDDWFVANNPENVGQEVGTVRSRLKTSFEHYLSNGNFKQANKFLGARGSQGFIPQ